MARKCALALLIAAILCAVSLAQYYPPPPYDYYGNTGASTAFGSAAQGMAQVIGAQGSYNLQTAQAAVYATQAESQEIANRKQATDTYFDMRRTNEAYQAAHRDPRLSKEQYARMAAEDAPKRLTTSQFDPATGKIDWPDLLQGSEYDSYRMGLDKLFEERAKPTQTAGSDMYRSIRDFCKRMLQQLRTHADEVPDQISSREYMNSKYFIDSLAYEGRSGGY